ncbi:hypothetical protein JCM1393_07050 [Clostridium carnis]
MKISEFYNTKNSKTDIFLAMVIFYSNITYYPFFTSIELVNIITRMLWILLFLVLIFKNRIVNRGIIKYIACICSFDVYILFLEIITDKNYVFSRFVYPINLCIFIIFIGSYIGININENKLRFYFKWYIYSSFILSLLIYINYFMGVNWINSMDTIVVQKNSISMVFLLSIILLIFVHKFKKNLWTNILIVYFSIMLVIIKSRAALVGLILVFIYFFLKLKLKHKIITIFIVIISIFFINKYTNLLDYLIFNIFLNNRAKYGIDAISSGRQEHLNIFKDLFVENPLIGRGSFYLEAFPLASLMSYGIIGSIPIFIMSLLPLVDFIKAKNEKKCSNIRIILFIIWAVIILNGLFEELAPFGPGIKCYILWLFVGILQGCKIKRKV